MKPLAPTTQEPSHKSFWQKTKHRFFAKESGFPFWTAFGPLTSFFALGCFSYMQPTLMPICGFAFALSQLLILRWKKVGLILAPFLFIYPFFVVSSLSTGYNLLFSFSTYLGFYILSASLAEVEMTGHHKEKEWKKLEEENALWPKRFETLNSQYQQIQTDFEELQAEFDNLEKEHQKEMVELQELVKTSSGEASFFQKRVDQLHAENLLRSRVQEESRNQIEALQNEVESLRLKLSESSSHLASQQIEDALAQNQSLLTEIEILKMHIEEVSHPLHQKIEELQQENVTLRETMEQEASHEKKLLEEEIYFLKDQIEEVKKPLESRLAKLEEENKHLSAQIQPQVDHSAFQEEIQFLKMQLLEADLEMNELKGKSQEKDLKKISELENELELLRKQLSDATSLSSAETPKKGEKKKLRVSDDELLFGFYDVSNSALENVMKYKTYQTDDLSEKGLF